MFSRFRIGEYYAGKDRFDRLTEGINLDGVGLEIGALDRPIIFGKNAYYADYCSSEQLKINHSGNPSVVNDNIVNVDFVTGGKNISEVIPEDLRFDYVFASHVAEHIPDLISWLKSIKLILKTNGKLRLIIPNKDKCFDIRRSLTEEKDIISSYLEKRVRPSPIQVFDFYRLHDRDGRLVHDFSQSLQMANLSMEQYVDAHCWVFTPISFLELMKTLIESGLVPFDIEFVADTVEGEIDFFVGFH